MHSSAWQQTLVVHQIMPQDGSPVVRVVYNVVDFQCYVFSQVQIDRQDVLLGQGGSINEAQRRVLDWSN